MDNASETVVVGKLGAPFGVKGWLKIISFTEYAENIFDYQPWNVELQGQIKALNVTQWQKHNKGLIAKLEGIDDRDMADACKNAEISVPSKSLPDLPEGEYYWKDLEGYKVITTNNYDLGELEQFMETGANDVMVVKANAKDAFGQKERLIPFILDHTVVSVEQEEKLITVDWDPGF